MTIAIIIPARYGSTRFPGKPLAKIGGKTMLAHVVETARKAAASVEAAVNVYVTTDDDRIATHAREDVGVDVIMTSETCETGSDRVHEAVQTLEQVPDFIINLQGDAPFTPVSIITGMIERFIAVPDISVITPVCSLDWKALEALREYKKTTPFSGTTAIADKNDRALWFSKTIIPAIRKENTMRESKAPCPVLQHIGLYGYTPAALTQFCALPPSHYEQLEGLEQLRFIENGIPIDIIRVSGESASIQSGIDTPEDLARAEQWLADPASKK